MPEFPFSNIWAAKQLAPNLPAHSVLHLGILNSLRSWNFFSIPGSVSAYSNVGGFGIDGAVSALLGASLANPAVLHFGVVGDLAFFYDMNALGNRYLKPNMRLLMVNNGKGVEFRNFNHPANQFGEEADLFMAAGGHFGRQSHTLVKNFAQDLGMEYLSASTKEEFSAAASRFLHPQITDKPMLFEIFTNTDDERNALEEILSIQKNFKGEIKQSLKKTLGPTGIRLAKQIFKK